MVLKPVHRQWWWILHRSPDACVVRLRPATGPIVVGPVGAAAAAQDVAHVVVVHRAVRD